MDAAAGPPNPNPARRSPAGSRAYVAEFTLWINNIEQETAGPTLLAELFRQVIDPLVLGQPEAAALLSQFVGLHGGTGGVGPSRGLSGACGLPEPQPKLVRTEHSWSGQRVLRGRQIGNLRVVLGFLTGYKVTLNHTAWIGKIQQILAETGNAASIPFCRLRVTFTGRSPTDPLYQPYIVQAVAEEQAPRQAPEAEGPKGGRAPL